MRTLTDPFVAYLAAMWASSPWAEQQYRYEGINARKTLHARARAVVVADRVLARCSENCVEAPPRG